MSATLATLLISAIIVIDLLIAQQSKTKKEIEQQ
jgi:hypothetical protein